MPRYDRHCEDCDTVFEVTCKISEKGDDHNCPNCDSTKGEWYIGTPAFCDSHRLSTAKKDTGFKEVLQKIAERNPRTSICERV